MMDEAAVGWDDEPATPVAGRGARLAPPLPPPPPAFAAHHLGPSGAAAGAPKRKPPTLGGPRPDGLRPESAPPVAPVRDSRVDADSDADPVRRGPGRPRKDAV